MNLLILDTTSTTLVGALAETETTTALDYTVSYGDATSAGMTEGVSLSTSNSTNNVTMCSAPASSTRRLIRNVTVSNNDTVAHNFLLKIYNGSSYFTVAKKYLISGEVWSFQDMSLLVLDSTSKSLRLKLGEVISANQADVSIHYADITSTALTEGKALANSSGTSNVEILAAPASSTRRVIKNITIHNADTVAHVVYVYLRNTSTDYLVIKQTIPTGKSWAFGEPDVLLASGLSDWGEQSATPASPATGKMKLYFKSDEKLYKLNSSGTETEMGQARPLSSSETSSATPTINTDNVTAHSVTALATNITSFTTNLSGTPVNFQKLIIRIKDNGTARTIAWGSSFEARGVDLPTTTVLSKVLTVGFIYDTVSAKWGCVASSQEA